MSSELFAYGLDVASALDIGRRRSSNQDEVICVDNLGFYAVSDGMGGLLHGGETSAMVARVLPELVSQCASELLLDESLGKQPAPSAETLMQVEQEGLGEKSAFALQLDPDKAAALLADAIQSISDNIYEAANSDGAAVFGATLSAVWFVGRYAVFANIGDSRSYLLHRYKHQMRQVSIDHNVAQILVRSGELTQQEARGHPSSSQLTHFIGMDAPAVVDCFIEEIVPGDRILLCSDGLYGEIEDHDIRALMRSGRSPRAICSQMVQKANENGGRDNISAVYIKVGKGE